MTIRRTARMRSREAFSRASRTVDCRRAPARGSELTAMRAVSKTVNPGSNPGSPAPPASRDAVS